jgi:hypothetical protein
VELARCWGVAENGAVVEVAVAPSLVGELESRWPPFGLERRYQPAEPIEARFGLSDAWMVVPDREPSGTSPSLAAWDHLETELTMFAVTRLNGIVPVHSASIAWKGSVLVVPARPEAGKSTLALAAHEFGAEVLSDEYTLIDPYTGLVTGWTRSVRRRNPDGTVDLVDIAVPSDPLLIAGQVEDGAVVLGEDGFGVWVLMLGVQGFGWGGRLEGQAVVSLTACRAEDSSTMPVLAA